MIRIIKKKIIRSEYFLDGISSLVRGAKNELYQFISYTNSNEDTELNENFKQRCSRVIPCDTILSLDKFQLIRTLGRGSFGRVVLALLKSDTVIKTDGSKCFAIKVMDKRKLVRYKQIDHTLNERRVLYSVQHPNTVRFLFSFKDNSFVYLVLQYITGKIFNVDSNKSNRLSRKIFLFRW